MIRPTTIVIAAQAGIHFTDSADGAMDCGLRRNDERFDATATEL